MRLGFITRIALIVTGALLIIQILALSARTWSDDEFNLGGISRPAVKEIVDLVDYFDTLPSADRAVAQATARIARTETTILTAAPEPQSAGPLLDFAAAAIAQRIASTVEHPRLVSVSFSPLSHPSRAIGLFQAWSGRELSLVFKLRDGSFLVINPRGDLFFVGGLLVLGAIIASLIVILLTIIAVGHEARPLVTLARNSELFAQTAKPVVTAETGARELRTLIRATNAMQQQIAALITNRTLILAGLSHDLRTEATRLRLRLELMDPSPARERAIADLETMQMLIENNLEFAKVGLEPGDEEVEAAPVIAEAVERFVQAGADVLADYPQAPVLLPLSATSLRRLVDNLISNALRYAGSAEIRLWQEGGRVGLDIADNGPGIPPDHRERIFEPFYRIEDSRGRATGGSGLGLAIVKQIVERQGGRVEVLDRQPSGALFRLSFGTSTSAE